MKRQPAEDAEWVRSAIRLYEGRLVRYVARTVGDTDRARDVVQEAFIKLCDQSADRLQDRVCEWLFTVCRNRALDLLRKDGRMTALNEQDLNMHPSGQPSPAVQAQRHDEMNRAKEFMDGLPQIQQEVVRLKFQEGLSYKEISHITSLSVSNVGVHIHNALKTLRERMRREEGTFEPGKELCSNEC